MARYILSFVALCLVTGSVSSFTVSTLVKSPSATNTPYKSVSTLYAKGFAKGGEGKGGEGKGGEDPVDELPEDRKATLFQFLLRDLEIEGVPLLGCDADQANTLQAALWTTMAEISEKDEAERACLVLESIPIDGLKVFVDDFAALKAQDRLMDHLPELKRISVSLVGKGVGPAILIESLARTDEEKASYRKMQEASPNHDENKCNAAMKAFVDRMAAGKEMCPFTKSNSEGPSGLESLGVKPGPIAYRSTRSADVCDVISSFWSCNCELLSLPEEQLSAAILSLPAIGTGSSTKEAHARFSAVAELISRNLFLYRGGDVFELQHMHPLYDRSLIYPEDKPAHGHLPPTGWLRAILRHDGKNEEAGKLSDEDLELQNYQRRSPVPAVIIKRITQLNAATTDPESGVVEIDLGDGRKEMAAAVPTYSRNVIRLASEGKEALRAALDAEIAITA